MPAHRNLCERFWEKVDRSGGSDACWPWTGALDGHGYGQIGTGLRRFGTRGNMSSHRVAWALTGAPLDDAMCVLHRCDNPPCVNPAHLFLGSMADNMHDMIAKGRARHPVGAAAACVLLTEAQVLEARARYAAGGIGHRRLAQHYGVHRATMQSILRRRTWTHI